MPRKRKNEKVKRSQLRGRFWASIEPNQRGYGDAIDLLVAYMPLKTLERIVKEREGNDG